MSSPDDVVDPKADTVPPPAGTETDLPPAPVIGAGQARAAIVQAASALVAAVLQFESVAMAVARQLDDQATSEGT